MSHHSQAFFFWKHRCLWAKFSVLVTSHMFCMLHQIPISEYVLTSLWSCQLLIHCWEVCYLMPTDLWILHISVIDLKFFKLHLWAEGRSAQATAYLWRSEDKFQDSILSFYHEYPRSDWAIRLQSKSFHVLTHPLVRKMYLFGWLILARVSLAKLMLSLKSRPPILVSQEFRDYSCVSTHPTITNF